MAVIIDIDHEANNLDEYSTTVTDGGKLSVAAGAALAGTNYGLSVEVGDRDDKYGQISADSAKATLRYRLYIDINSLSMPAESYTYYFYQHNGAGTLLVRISLYYTGASYRTYITARNDAGTAALSDYDVLSDAPHYIEVKLVSATNSTSADGTIEWWVDGTSEGSAANVDNYNIMNDSASRFRIGAIETSSASIEGTFYLDQFVVNDDGGAIGPYVAPATAKPAFLQYQ